MDEQSNTSMNNNNNNTNDNDANANHPHTLDNQNNHDDTNNNNHNNANANNMNKNESDSESSIEELDIQENKRSTRNSNSNKSNKPKSSNNNRITNIPRKIKDITIDTDTRGLLDGSRKDFIVGEYVLVECWKDINMGFGSEPNTKHLYLAKIAKKYISGERIRSGKRYVAAKKSHKTNANNNNTKGNETDNKEIDNMNDYSQDTSNKNSNDAYPINNNNNTNSHNQDHTNNPSSSDYMVTFRTTTKRYRYTSNEIFENNAYNTHIKDIRLLQAIRAETKANEDLQREKELSKKRKKSGDDNNNDTDTSANTNTSNKKGFAYDIPRPYGITASSTTQPGTDNTNNNSRSGTKTRPKTNDKSEVLIGIIGAGAAGLSAARELLLKGYSPDKIVIIEARNRIGGRIYTRTIGDLIDEWKNSELQSLLCNNDKEKIEINNQQLNQLHSSGIIEAGAAFIHDYGTSHPLFRAIKHYGLVRKLVGKSEGLEIWLKNNRHIPQQHIEDIRALYELVTVKVVEYAGQVRAAKQPDQPLSQAFNHCLHEIIDSNSEKAQLYQNNKGIWDAIQTSQHAYNIELDKLSLFDVLDVNKQCNTNVEYTLPLGLKFLFECLAKELQSCQWKFNAIVEQIIQHETNNPTNDDNNNDYAYAEIKLSNGESLFFDHVICTIPLACLQKQTIQFSPPLPQNKIDSINKLGAGVENKLILVWPRSVKRIVDLTNKVTEFDNTVQFYRNPNQSYKIVNLHGLNIASAAINVQCAPPLADEFDRADSSQEKHQVYLKLFKTLQEMFGNSLPEPTLYYLTNWRNQLYSHMAYSYIPVGASTTDQFILALPFHRVFFAGEHTSNTDSQTIHGAMLSGESAAIAIDDHHKESKANDRAVNRLQRLFAQQQYQENCNNDNNNTNTTHDNDMKLNDINSTSNQDSNNNIKKDVNYINILDPAFDPMASLESLKMECEYCKKAALNPIVVEEWAEQTDETVNTDPMVYFCDNECYKARQELMKLNHARNKAKQQPAKKGKVGRKKHKRNNSSDDYSSIITETESSYENNHQDNNNSDRNNTSVEEADANISIESISKSNVTISPNKTSSPSKNKRKTLKNNACVVCGTNIDYSSSVVYAGDGVRLCGKPECIEKCAKFMEDAAIQTNNDAHNNSDNLNNHNDNNHNSNNNSSIPSNNVVKPKRGRKPKLMLDKSNNNHENSNNKNDNKDNTNNEITLHPLSRTLIANVNAMPNHIDNDISDSNNIVHSDQFNVSHLNIPLEYTLISNVHNNINDSNHNIVFNIAVKQEYKQSNSNANGIHQQANGEEEEPRKPGSKLLSECMEQVEENQDNNMNDDNNIKEEKHTINVWFSEFQV